jgi:lysozyme family protein
MAQNRRFEECIALVLKHEGGFVNHPADPGGATNRGITLNTLREWRGDASLDVDAVRSLTEAEAREIYLARYWNPIRADELPAGLDLVMLDWAVHGGVSRAARDLQAVLGVSTDGAIGRHTLAAVAKADAADLIRLVSARRIDYLRSRPHWQTFGRGWERRVGDVEAAALRMASRPALTIREAQGTNTVRIATGAASVVAPAAAAIPSALGALADLDRYVGLALVAGGLVALVMAAWLAVTWLRMHKP